MALSEFVTHVLCLWAGAFVGFWLAAILTSASRADTRMRDIVKTPHGHAPDIDCYYCKERGWQ